MRCFIYTRWLVAPWGVGGGGAFAAFRRRRVVKHLLSAGWLGFKLVAVWPSHGAIRRGLQEEWEGTAEVIIADIGGAVCAIIARTIANWIEGAMLCCMEKRSRSEPLPPFDGFDLYIRITVESIHSQQIDNALVDSGYSWLSRTQVPGTERSTN